MGHDRERGGSLTKKGRKRKGYGNYRTGALRWEGDASWEKE